jgi:hypothetical protein
MAILRQFLLSIPFSSTDIPSLAALVAAEIFLPRIHPNRANFLPQAYRKKEFLHAIRSYCVVAGLHGDHAIAGTGKD